MKQVQNDLRFLQGDIATVKDKRRWLVMSKDRHYKRLHGGSPVCDLNKYPGCDSTSTGGAESVWRGGQGGAYAPSGEANPFRAERPTIRPLTNVSVSTDKGKASGIVGNDLPAHSLGESSGVHKVSKKRRVLAQVYFFVTICFKFWSSYVYIGAQMSRVLQD